MPPAPPYESESERELITISLPRRKWKALLLRGHINSLTDSITMRQHNERADAIGAIRDSLSAPVHREEGKRDG